MRTSSLLPATIATLVVLALSGCSGGNDPDDPVANTPHASTAPSFDDCDDYAAEHVKSTQSHYPDLSVKTLSVDPLSPGKISEGLPANVDQTAGTACAIRYSYSGKNIATSERLVHASFGEGWSLEKVVEGPHSLAEVTDALPVTSDPREALTSSIAAVTKVIVPGLVGKVAAEPPATLKGATLAAGVVVEEYEATPGGPKAKVCLRHTDSGSHITALYDGKRLIRSAVIPACVFPR